MKTIKNPLLALLLGFIIVVSSGVQAMRRTLTRVLPVTFSSAFGTMQRTNNEDEPCNIKKIQQGVQSESLFTQVRDLQWFNARVRGGEEICRAIRAAQRGMLSENRLVQEYALQLFGELVRNGLEIDEAIQAAQQGMLSENSWIQFQALKLFCELVRKGQGVEAARAAAQQGIQSDGRGVREQAEALQEIIRNR